MNRALWYGSQRQREQHAFLRHAPMVIPVLQEHGLFRTAYEGATLREHFGLKPAVSRYARASGQPAAGDGTAVWGTLNALM